MTKSTFNNKPPGEATIMPLQQPSFPLPPGMSIIQGGGLVTITGDFGYALDHVRQLRTTCDAVIMVILPEGSAVDQIVSLLNAGADDVVTTAITVREFEYRAKVRLRYLDRRHGLSGVSVGNAHLPDNDNRLVIKTGETIALRPYEARVLRALMNSQGRTMRKTAIAQDIYRDDPTGGPEDLKIIDVFVCILRRKLRQATTGFKIETVWGEGYRLVVEKPTSYAIAAE